MALDGISPTPGGAKDGHLDADMPQSEALEARHHRATGPTAHRPTARPPHSNVDMNTPTSHPQEHSCDSVRVHVHARAANR